MTEPIELLRAARHVVVQDFPAADVPESLTRAGLEVTIYGGPDPADVVACEVRDGRIEYRPVGRRPESADLLSVFRPSSEIPQIVAEARRLGVRAVWRQRVAGEPGDAADPWRSAVIAAGLEYVDQPPIEQVARTLTDS